MPDKELPVLKPNKVINTLKRAGFYIHHQTGSHVQLKHKKNPALRVTIPSHKKDLPKPIIRSIIRQSGLSVEEFKKLLK